MMTETGIGAGWAHSGSLPPWMQRSPGFDEADAADRAQDRAALAAALRAEQLRIDLFAERHGPLDELAAESRRLPRPPALAELATLAADHRQDPDYALRRAVLLARRRAVLNAALDHHTEDHPAAACGLAA